MQKTLEITDSQFKALLKQCSVEEAHEAIVILRQIIDQDTKDNINFPLKELGLSKRILTALSLAKITMLKDLLEYDETPGSLRHFRKLGAAGIKEIEEKVFAVYGKGKK